MLAGYKMSTLARTKRKLKLSTLTQKCKIISEIEKGLSNKAATEKYGVPKNTILTWMKNKSNIFIESLEAQQWASVSKKSRGCDYNEVDKAPLKWSTVNRQYYLN